MKKIFTLIAAALVAVSVSAQTEWNFSNWDAGSYKSTFEKDGLKVYAAEGAGVDIDDNSKTVDGVKYTQRLKFGGTAAFVDGHIPSARVLEFNVPGASTLYFVYCSSSSSGDDRPFMVEAVVNDNVEVLNNAYAPVGTESLTVNYTGSSAAKIYVYSGKSGINIYTIKVTSGGSTGITSVENAVEADAATYNIAGQRVNANAKGLVIKNGKKYINR